MEVSLSIENLVSYGRKYLGLTLEDGVYAKNQLLALFNETPAKMQAEEKSLNEILSVLIKRALYLGMIHEGGEMRFETKLLGLVTPSSGFVIREYVTRYANGGAQEATNYLYNLSKNNKYIRMEDIAKNIKWTAEGEKGEIGITINLSKPEKDNKQVAAEREATGEKYPKCLLCLENLGFVGTATHPARQTIRIVPIKLAGESWHMQYSPYMYYDEHVIAFADEHRPMAVTDKTFWRLADFVDAYPHYFIGSNADLPIVGGSILAHDHYQGGAKVLPMFKAEMRKVFYSSADLVVGIKDWYNSVITVEGTDRKRVLDACSKILSRWREYSDEEVGILASTDGTPHNTITPIATKNGEEYRFDLILRNNRTDEAHPDGIFHPTKEMHNIKKEGIGLIEAMGLFILPGRLKRELNAIEKLLSQKYVDFHAISSDELLSKHAHVVKQLAETYGTGLDEETVHGHLIDYVNDVCFKILECTAVFKNTDEGQEAFDRFAKSLLK